MTEKQNLKMELLKEFAISIEPESVGFCREAYKFLSEDEAPAEPKQVPQVRQLADGVYYTTGHGTAIPYKEVDKVPEDTKGVLVVQGECSIVVALIDAADDDTELTTQKDPEDCKGNYITKCIDAVDDWNGKENTEHLKRVGLHPNIRLEDGQYIPSMGEMLFIFTHRKAINEALEKADAQPIGDYWYWTSTEYSATYAWYLNLGDGGMSNGTKASYSNRVRAVSAFIS